MYAIALCNKILNKSETVKHFSEKEPKIKKNAKLMFLTLKTININAFGNTVQYIKS